MNHFSMIFALYFVGIEATSRGAARCSWTSAVGANAALDLVVHTYHRRYSVRVELQVSANANVPLGRKGDKGQLGCFEWLAKGEEALTPKASPAMST